MAVALSTLIPDVKSEVSPPGSDLYPNATDEDWEIMLKNAFWEAVIDKVIVGYTEIDGDILPIADGGADIPRDVQQLIVYYAGIRTLKNRLADIKTMFRTKAGPVEYETQQSAQVLKALLDEAVRRRNLWLVDRADTYGTPTYYVDAVLQRDSMMGAGVVTWVDG